MTSSSRPPPRGPLVSSFSGPGRCCRVEGPPRRLEERLESLELRLGDGGPVARRRGARRAEVRRGIPFQPLNDGEGRDVRHLGEFEPGWAHDPGVAGAVFPEGLEGRLLISPAAAPSRPIERTGEDPFLSDFQVDRYFVAGSCHSPGLLIRWAWSASISGRAGSYPSGREPQSRAEPRRHILKD